MEERNLTLHSTRFVATQLLYDKTESKVVIVIPWFVHLWKEITKKAVVSGLSPI